MTHVLRIVFSKPTFLIMSCIIFVFMTVGMLMLSEYIFLDPYIVSHLPSGTEIGFALILTISALSALVIPINVYRIAVMRSSMRKISGGSMGSIIGVAAGACSCGPVGFAVISTFGSIGASATAFLTVYEIPIRVIAIAILVITYFTTMKSLKIECKIN